MGHLVHEPFPLHITAVQYLSFADGTAPRSAAPNICQNWTAERVCDAKDPGTQGHAGPQLTQRLHRLLPHATQWGTWPNSLTPWKYMLSIMKESLQMLSILDHLVHRLSPLKAFEHLEFWSCSLYRIKSVKQFLFCFFRKSICPKVSSTMTTWCQLCWICTWQELKPPAQLSDLD